MENSISIRDYIESHLESDDLDLPFPESIAVELNSMLGDDSTSVPALAQKIEKDPSLTAKILNLSNSAFYSGTTSSSTGGTPWAAPSAPRPSPRRRSSSPSPRMPMSSA
jgi:hypothetical protein